MAVLSKELIGGRETKEAVVYSAGNLDTSFAEVAWSSTTEHGTRTVTLDKAVAANQADRDVIDARVDAAADV